MENVKRVIGMLLILISFVIGVHFVIQSVYDSGDVWFILDFVMLATVVLVLIVSYARKRAYDAENDGLRTAGSNPALTASWKIGWRVLAKSTPFSNWRCAFEKNRTDFKGGRPTVSSRCTPGSTRSARWWS